jgi:hypothetical protein
MWVTASLLRIHHLIFTSFSERIFTIAVAQLPAPSTAMLVFVKTGVYIFILSQNQPKEKYFFIPKRK